MEYMRKLLKKSVFFISLILFFDPLLASSFECSKLFGHPRIPEGSTKLLSNLPKEIFSDKVPNNEFILSFDLKKVIENNLEMRGDFLETTLPYKGHRNFIKYGLEASEIYQGVKSSFEELKSLEGDYFFIGNGMHTTAQLFNYMNRGTEYSNRVKTLDVSRNLYEAKGYRSKIKKYFLSKGITKDHKGLIVLIDSIGNEPKGSKHTLFRLAVEITKHLVEQGMSLEQASEKITMLAITEISAPQSVRNRVEFQTALRRYINGKKPDGYYYTEVADYELKRLAMETYKMPRWNNSKFYDFDSKNQPIQMTRDILGKGLLMVEKEDNSYYRDGNVNSFFYHAISERLTYIYLMQSMYKMADREGKK